jgi:hypothetical protein
MGAYTTYSGGGYVFNITLANDNSNSIISNWLSEYALNLTFLQKLDWIDRQTRAVTVEYSTYNPNINLCSYNILLFEFLPTGQIVTTLKFTPINLFSEQYSFMVACDILYMLFIVYFMICELRSIVKLKLKYFKQFWSYIEWLIIGFSWAAFAIYFYRLNEANNIKNIFYQTFSSSSAAAFYEQYGYNESLPFINLQLVSNWNDIMGFCLAFTTCLGTLKFMKILRFNRRISMLSLTLKRCFSKLIAFGALFLIVYMAFVQLMYLIFGEQTLGFSTILKSMETCFKIMLGRFQAQPLIEASSILGPIVYSFYNLVVVFVLLNIFFSIMTDSYKFVKLESNDGRGEHLEEIHVFKYLQTKLKQWLPFLANKVGNLDDDDNQSKTSVKYQDASDYFPQSVDHLIDRFNIVSIEIKFFFYLLYII